MTADKNKKIEPNKPKPDSKAKNVKKKAKATFQGHQPDEIVNKNFKAAVEDDVARIQAQVEIAIIRGITPHKSSREKDAKEKVITVGLYKKKGEVLGDHVATAHVNPSGGSTWKKHGEGEDGWTKL